MKFATIRLKWKICLRLSKTTHFCSAARDKPKPKDFGPKSSRNNHSKGQQGNSLHREQHPQRQRQSSASQNSKKSTGNRYENKSTNSEISKKEGQANGGTKAQEDKSADSVPQTHSTTPAVNVTHAQEGNTADNGMQPQQDKSGEGDHVSPVNHRNQSKRQYVRKTPPDGSPIFRTRKVDNANATSAKVNGNNNESKGPDLRKEQLENKMANGTNDFVPLPQRSRRPRKTYHRKDPNGKIEFPPNRENGSVPA